MPPPPPPTHLPEPSSSPRAPGTMLGGSAGFYWTGEGVAAHWDGFRRGGFIMWASDLGISSAPPPPQAPTCLDPSSSPRARGAVLGGSAGSFRTGEGFAGRFGVGGGGLFMWASGKRGCLREVCNPSQSVSNLREFFLAKIPVINTGIPLSQVSLSRTLEHFSWPKFLL